MGWRGGCGTRLRKRSRRISILPLGLEAEQVLPEHAAGRIPIETDVRGGGVRVAPEALQRMVEKEPLPARREEKRIDRLNQQPHAECLVPPVAQAHVQADRLATLG